MKIKKKNKNSRENKISKTTKNNNISSSLRKIIYTKLNFYNYYEMNTFDYELAKL